MEGGSQAVRGRGRLEKRIEGGKRRRGPPESDSSEVISLIAMEFEMSTRDGAGHRFGGDGVCVPKAETLIPLPSSRNGSMILIELQRVFNVEIETRVHV